MLLEWLPTGAAAPAPSGLAATASAPAGLSEGARARLQRLTLTLTLTLALTLTLTLTLPLTPVGARARLQRAVQMYEARGGGALSEAAVLHALEGFELRPTEEEADRAACAALLEQARGGTPQRPLYLPHISAMSPPYLPGARRRDAARGGGGGAARAGLPKRRRRQVLGAHLAAPLYLP